MYYKQEEGVRIIFFSLLPSIFGVPRPLANRQRSFIIAGTLHFPPPQNAPTGEIPFLPPPFPFHFSKVSPFQNDASLLEFLG